MNDNNQFDPKKLEQIIDDINQHAQRAAALLLEQEQTKKIVEETVVEEIVEEKTTEETVEEKIAEEVVDEQVVEEPVEEEITDEQVTDESVNEETVEETNDTAITEETVEEKTVEEVVDEQVVEEQVTEESVNEETVEEQITEEQDNGGKKKKTKRWRTSLFTKFLILVDVCALICFYVFYGPMTEFRAWFISTSIHSGSHQYYAYTFYDYTTIAGVLETNKTVESDEATDTSKVTIVENPDTGVYASEYEREILEHDEDEDYKVLHWVEDTFEVWLTVIYDSTRLELVQSPNSYGSIITSLASYYNATIAINAGGFYLYSDNTQYAMGSVILDGEIYSNSGSSSERLICMTYDGVLMLMRGTASQAISAGAKWGLSFGPFLIVNGVRSTFTGNSGYGYRARTAIGQRADGVILLLTIDGLYGSASGASMEDLADIFERYGAVNAANLDGGGSTSLVIAGELINNPEGYGYTGERYIYNGIIFK